MSEPLPEPPLKLVQRTGWLGRRATARDYDERSAGVAEMIGAVLPAEWSWDGKRVLDFGCGVGRVLRHFAPQAAVAEFSGCDIHGPSVEWVQRNLCPPFNAFQCSEQPPLPRPDGSFDLIYAMSVYTHLTDHWAAWLLEHHRVLAEGGLLLVSFLGEAMIGPLIGEPWDEGGIGMNALWAGRSWDDGGPIVFHSPWWLQAHWGRAFEVVRLIPHTGDSAPMGHGLILLRRKPVRLAAEDLERLEPGDDREVAALAHNVAQLHRETVELRAEIDRLHHTLSWRLTEPLRVAKRIVRRTTGAD